jgi:hypothetical protein
LETERISLSQWLVFPVQSHLSFTIKYLPYRKRLIEAGVIDAERRGKLEMTVPFLGEYLRGELR